MSYHPLDDLPDDPPSLPGHEPDERPFPQIGLSPAEVTVTCSCGGWSFASQESVGGGVEPWGDAWDDHLEEVAQDDGADCGDAA